MLGVQLPYLQRMFGTFLSKIYLFYKWASTIFDLFFQILKNWGIGMQSAPCIVYLY